MEETTFRSVTAQMYPEWLPLGEPEARGPEMNYLDMSIKHNNVTLKWSSKLYDKQRAMVAKRLKLNKFPHPESKLSERCKYGVITSQLHRYAVACSNIKHFMESATELYSAYVKKGYRIPNINYYFERFIRNNMTSLSPRAVQSKYWAQQGHRRQNE